MPSLNLSLPNLTEKSFDDAKERQKLLEYLFQLDEALRYLLNHIDVDNLAPDLARVVTEGDGNEEMMSAIEQNSRMISLKVSRGKVISEINQSAEEVKIQAGKISLEGLVTVNGGFKIHTDGSMEATAGSLGAFSADAAGNLAGAASLKVGGMTLSGNQASGLKIGVDNLSYVNGQPSGSNDAYFLMVTDTGVMCLADLYMQDGQLVITTPGSAPSQGSTVNVVMVTSMGTGLIKYAAPNTSSASYGMCYAGEIYGYTGTTVSGGLTWVYCNRKYTYNSSTARYVGASVTPFYVPQANASGSERYLDFTVVTT